MAFLQIYWEFPNLPTFLQVYLNSKEASCLSWQNTYPNLKTTCHIKLKFFLWTELLKNLLLGKYFISVAVPWIYWKLFENLCTSWLVILNSFPVNVIVKYKPLSWFSMQIHWFHAIWIRHWFQFFQIAICRVLFAKFISGFDIKLMFQWSYAY